MKRILIYILLLILLILSASCGKKEQLEEQKPQEDPSPVEITAFRIFGDNMENPYHKWYYLEWKNTGEKTIDSISLLISGRFQQSGGEPEEQTLTIKILEPDGIHRNQHNRNRIQQLDSLMENEQYTLQATEISYTDGTVFTVEQICPPIETTMWDERGEGEMPVRLNEACFWMSSANADRIDYQIDWTNRSSNKEILGVIYRIVPKDTWGNPLKNDEGEDMLFYETSISMDDCIGPGQDNRAYEGSLSLWFNHGLEQARMLDLSIARAIDATGAVWENPQADRTVTCILSGKKGYAFDGGEEYPAVMALAEQIDAQLSEYGLSFSSPEIYVKPQKYCVLRYPDLDVRAELTEENNISPEKVGFALYSPHPNGDQEKIRAILDQTSELRLAIIPSVLTEIPRDKAVAQISDYNENDLGYIDFDDQTYDTFEEIANIYAADGSVLVVTFAAFGRDLYNPTNDLIWAKEPAYEEYRNQTVPHRPAREDNTES